MSSEPQIQEDNQAEECEEQEASPKLARNMSVALLTEKFERVIHVHRRSSRSVKLKRSTAVSPVRTSAPKSPTSKGLEALKKQLDTLALEVKPSYIKEKEQADGIPVKPLRTKKQRPWKDVDSKHIIAAAREGNLDVAKWLISNGADPNATDGKGRSALLIAAAFDKLGTFRYLLDVCDVLQTDHNGWNALHIAAIAGHMRIVEEAIKRIPLDERSRGGMTPLCLAVNRGHLHIVEYLLKKGADVRIHCKNQWNVLHFAVKGRHTLILYVLLNLYMSDCMALLNDKNFEGMTPVSVAVKSNCLDCVRQLLDSGADPNIPDENGWTPARIAAINNYSDIFQYLARYKAVM